MSKFNPTKPYGHVRGNFAAFPNARYSQGPYYYDNQRRCLNPEAEPFVEADVIDDATKSLIDSAQKAADDALLRMQRAKSKVEEDPTSGHKSALTKATKVYEKAQTKLEKLLS